MDTPLIEVEFARWADPGGREVVPAFTTKMPRVPAAGDYIYVPAGTRFVVRQVRFDLSADHTRVERILAVLEDESEQRAALLRFRDFTQGDDPDPKGLS